MFERPRPPLAIHPTSFKPSLLSIVPSPFSPRTPLPVIPNPARSISTSLDPNVSTSATSAYPLSTTSAPSSPLSWMWQCHHCQRTYHLGATRRCLDDGHLFCSGTSAAKQWREPMVQRRIKRHRACSSEFDFAGWKAWGRWRRGGQKRRAGVKKDCWRACDYPSECRWGRRVGIHSPETAEFELTSPPPRTLAPMPDLTMGTGLSSSDWELGGDFFANLLASAKRRKSAHLPSPLAATQSPIKEGNGDIKMAATTTTIGSVAMDMLKDLMSRKAVRRAGKNAVPMLTVGKCVDVDMEGMGGVNENLNVGGCGDATDVGMDFAPLERVESRH
ncbi:hypothetical protein DE146DRAFT_711436 [Phaeosphaeria sp. MPI-PUGE-AT-0046c]|nr:hypothetical protein DE146DRAFT_711436 [Phaeosphaeria sp. MPI-PUGE-AT-0046c]